MKIEFFLAIGSTQNKAPNHNTITFVRPERFWLEANGYFLEGSKSDFDVFESFKPIGFFQPLAPIFF